MTSKKYKEFLKENKHRDYSAVKIECEQRTLDNGMEVSQILFYFFDKEGMGDYEILSSKKLPVDHAINKTLVNHFKLILENEK
jgi:hypothetical protein